MAQNEKGGSDLDIFEALGKKGPAARPAGSSKTVPPPPPAHPSARPPAPTNTSQTLLGLSVPSVASSPGLGGRTPPPPPGRGSLPPVVKGANGPSGTLPPPPAPSSLAAIPPPLAAPVAAPKPSSTGVDVNWDDEDEATHIFDDGHEKAAQAAAPAPMPAPTTGARPVPKATLLGLAGAPLPPPPATSRPPTAPPPPMRSGYPQAGTSNLPPPMGGLPPPPQTTPGLGNAFPVRSQLPPPPHAASSPPAPMGMPAPTPFPRSAPSPDYLMTPHKMEATALVRPPRKRTALWVALGLAGVAVLGVLWMYGGGAHTGRIVVNVTDAKGASVNRVDIFVDGRHQCDTAPCLVDSVAAGDHEVKVLAEGFDAPPIQQVSVEGHKDATATFALGGAKGSGVKVSGTQPGVKLYVDDKEIGPLPQDLHDLPPGDHTIRIAGSERYQPLEKKVTVEKDQSVDLGSVTLKVLKGKATINAGTPGARVYLVSGSDRRELPMLPISVDIDTAKSWSLEASKAGFDDFKQPISFDDGQAEKTLTVTLEPKSGGAPAPVAYSPPPAPTPAPAPAPVRQAAPAPANEGGEAFLNINSIPPSTCFLDGRSLGSTPRVHVSVTPGSHTVKFINADQGLTKTLSVSVGAGETKPAVAKLN